MKFYRVTHYAISDRYVRSEDELDGIWSACGRIDAGDGDEVPRPAWPGFCPQLHLPAVSREEAIEMIAE